ncbi:MAG TPA: hypothetical protein VML50_03600 [Anaeromyxobacter sp.]|nr:hypothetical protein [Anaeromyxobacter sp.]
MSGRACLAGAALLALALGCSGPRAPAREGITALVERGDVEQAGARLTEGDAWSRLGAALLAHRALDAEGEVRSLLAAVGAAPGDPVALVALRRLAAVCEVSPSRAAQVDAGLTGLLATGRLGGLAAYRARVARAVAAETRSDHEATAARRRENGAVSAWTLVGPFGRLPALDFDALEPETGPLPASVPGRPGEPLVPARTLPAPDGSASLEGEPVDGDVFLLATDATLAQGGRYLLTLGTAMSARLVVDGAVLFQRRAFAAPAPGLVHLPLALAAGRHRIAVKLSRAGPRTGLLVALSREDGAPSDAVFAPAGPGPGPEVAARPVPAAPVLGARALAAALEPGAGPVLARLLAAQDALGSEDREAAKALLREALALRPSAPALHAALAEALRDDPSLDDRVARARAESELDEALRLDPGDAASRVALAALLRADERRDDADAALAGLSGPAAGSPLALDARARAAADRGLAERAEALAREALEAGGSCDAADLAYDLASRRSDVAREDEAARGLALCRGGRERLAGHLRRRGDPAGARAILDPLVRTRPWAIEPGLARAEALVADGEPGLAAEGLSALAAVWPRSPRVLRALADARELAGDAQAARAARQRALALDGAELALRRALALEDGPEVLDDLAGDGKAALREYQALGRRSGASAALVLDLAAIDIHPGGVATERTHQVIHVLDQHGVERYGEVDLPAGAELLALRTLKPDGRTLEPDRTGSGKGAISLAGLEPGDAIEVDYVRAVRGRRGGGYAADPFFFQVPGASLFRSVYVVRAPAGLGLEADGHGMEAPAPVREGAFEVIRAERRDAPAVVPEPDAPGGAEFLPFLAVGVGGGRDALVRGLADALAGRTRPTLELSELAAEIRAAAGPKPTPAALARAAYGRVARTVLGQGGSLAEDASAVLSRGRGSRVIVLKALLGALGVEARLALVRPFAADPAPYRFETLAHYPSVLLRVKAGGEIFWLDPSTRLAPFGAFPAGLTGCEALVVPEPGEAVEATRTPVAALVPDQRELRARIAVDADGNAGLSGSDRYQGASAGELKEAFGRLDAADRRQAIEAMLGRNFRGVTVSEVTVAGEEDPDVPLEIRWKARAPDLVRASDGGLVLEAPLFPVRLGARYVRLATRTTPLLVPAEERLTQRIEVVAPPGAHPQAEASRRIASPFGVLSRTEQAQGDVLVREERLELERGRIPPERYPEFGAFAGAVDQLQERPVTFTR